MEEFFDILDPTGKPTGYTCPRSQAHREGLWHSTVHIWVLDQWERLLLQQRSLQKDSHPGLWDISAAGHLTAGQSRLEAAVRELHEELGLAIAAERLQYLCEEREEYRSADGLFVDREFHAVYLLRLEAGEERKIQPDPIELAGVRWISPEVLACELRDHPEFYVPHAGEYARLLTALAVC